MRLVIEDANSQRTELIWEGYFNREAGMALNGGPTVLNQWQTTTNMQNGRFWFNRPPTAPGQPNLFVGTNCADNNFTFWQGGIPATTLGTLLGVDGCLRNAEARIVGIAVGVGSQWPHAYRGFVDNRAHGFNGQRVLDANFDFVPRRPSPSRPPTPSWPSDCSPSVQPRGSGETRRKVTTRRSTRGALVQPYYPGGPAL